MAQQRAEVALHRARAARKPHPRLGQHHAFRTTLDQPRPGPCLQRVDVAPQRVLDPPDTPPDPVAGVIAPDEVIEAVLVNPRKYGAAVTDDTTNGACSGAADLAALKTETEKMGDVLRALVTSCAAAGIGA